MKFSNNCLMSSSQRGHKGTSVRSDSIKRLSFVFLVLNFSEVVGKFVGNRQRTCVCSRLMMF